MDVREWEEGTKGRRERRREGENCNAKVTIKQIMNLRVNGGTFKEMKERVN